METTDAQVRRLMEELSKHGKIGLAALRSGMSETTARRYRELGKLPSELKGPRTWRTRPDPFEEDWAELAEKLREAPELEAQTLFEDLMERRPGKYSPGQLRTLQRRVRSWRAEQGPPKEVFFAQEHRPGEALQTDFTHGEELGVTVGGEAFSHLLCHVVLPYSNWEHATVCRSESMAALKRGVQSACFRLGRVPRWHQTDNSTAATHDLRTGKRGFNEEYEALCRHLGMQPRTIAVGKKEQNGDVESQHRHLKRRLNQHLLLRGSRDFESVEAWEGFVGEVLERANGLRRERVAEELAQMRPLDVKRLPESVRVDVQVSPWSTIRVKHNAYSVPSRLIGETVEVQLFEDRLEVHHSGQHQLTTERLVGRGGHRVDYRHIIWSLVRKPGAFARYRYREELFPTVVFRRAYDALAERLSPEKADLEYLRLLHLAAGTSQEAVEQALEALLGQGELPGLEAVRAAVRPPRVEVPEIAESRVELACYDALLDDAAGGER